MDNIKAPSCPNGGPGPVTEEARRALARTGWSAGRRSTGWVLAAVLLTALAVRSYHLSARSLWFDEAFSWRLIQFPLPEILERTALDNNPPFYFLVLRAWAEVAGTSAFGLRALSVLFGGLTVIGMYLFASETLRSDGAGKERAVAGGREVGLVVAALVALSPFQIRWAWEVRSYTLGTALAAFSSWALFRALRAPPRATGPWLLYGVFTLLFAYTHYYALFSIAAQALFLAVYLLAKAGWNVGTLLRSRLLWNAALAGLVVGVGWSPWIPIFLRQRAQVQADFWIHPVGWADAPKVCYEMFIDPQDANLTFAKVLAAAALGCVGLWVLLRRVRERIDGVTITAGEWYVLTAAVVPFAASVLISSLDTPVFHLRYFLFAHLFILAGLGVLMGREPSRVKRVVCYALVLEIFLVAYISFWQKLDIDHRPGARAAAEWIDGHRRPGDPVVVCSPLLYLPMLHHAKDRADYYAYGDWREVPHYMGAAVLLPEDFMDPEKLRTLTAERLWAVNIEGGWSPPAVPLSASWHPESRHYFREVYKFQGVIVVVKYERIGQ